MKVTELIYDLRKRERRGKEREKARKIEEEEKFKDWRETIEKESII